MINKKLIKKYIKYCIVLLFTANLYSMEGANNIKNNTAENMASLLRQYYDITRPLNQLIRDGRYNDFMNTIIQSQIHVNFIDESWQTPLILACIANDLELVKFILISGAIVDAVDLNGKSALCYAQENANNEIINLLIENNKNSKIYGSKVDKRYKCEVKDCPYATNGKSYFKAHMLAHNSKNYYRCNVEGCGYISTKKRNLDSHTQHQHPEVDVSYKYYECKIEGCPYTTNGKSYFKAHVLAHQNERQYKCKIEGCGYISTKKNNLDTHTQRNHPGVDVSYKYYKCKIEGCPYTTNGKLYFKAHMLAHQSENCYKCNVEGCGYISTNKDNLSSHTRRHHPENNDNARINLLLAKINYLNVLNVNLNQHLNVS